MLPFFSTFISGLDTLIDQWLREDINDIKIDTLQDGLVVFRTLIASHQIGKIRYLNNSFILISRYELGRVTPSAVEAMNLLFQDRGLGSKLAELGGVKGDSFKIVVTAENRMIAIGREGIEQLAGLIGGGTGLSHDGISGNREFWLVIRGDGIVLFGLRITALKNKTVAGELRLELTNSLCRLSDPVKSDVFMDPFCGSGAIFLERISSFGYKFAHAVDTDVSKIKLLEGKVSWTKEKVKIRVGNALELTDVETGSVGKMVADPPWGNHQKVEDLDEFYRRMLKEFSRVLKPGGIAVILVAREIELDKFVSEFKLLEKYQILVSGRKANILKFLRL